jgi:TadE-like protein
MRGQSSRGQSLVETSLILAAFMGLLVGMTGIGQSLFVRQTLEDRAHNAARWGAMNTYDPDAIRNLVRFGDAQPSEAMTPFAGIKADEVVIGNPGCPGANCRISVEIPGQGIRSVEPVEALF